MDLFIDGKLNSNAFDAGVRQATHDLNDVLLAAAQTQSVLIESTHFLIAVARVPGGVTQRGLAQLGVTLDQWENGLANCAQRSPGSLSPAHLTRICLHESGAALLRMAENLCAQYQYPRISEPILLLCALRHLTPAVDELCRDADIDVTGWREKLGKLIPPVKAVPVFEPDGAEAVILDSFSPAARKALGLMRNEAESLGYIVADPRHLLLALLEYERGATQYGIYKQGLTPRKIQEAILLNLLGKAKRTRSPLALDKEHLQPLLRHILAKAGELAGQDQTGCIAEPHLLRAFLEFESAARVLLENEKVNLARLRESAEAYDLAEVEEAEELTIADIETARSRLRRRLVGQDEAIERILPYIQRMRFGFTTPGRPVGVFLFCGQSGSGKTEMAKELARAIYGSEENLIFLEMGQFNSPESMNIFVGAPPGYIGYGEGKLTNGLRDKPQSVVLFDEIEKVTEPRVFGALLRFLDEGKIDDPAGPVRDGSQCIIVLTCNAGVKELSQLWNEVRDHPNWRSVVRKRLREELEKQGFRVEFLNRVDEMVLFRTLEEKDYAEIARRLLDRDLPRLRDAGRIEEITLDPSVAAEIGAYCHVIGEGARAAQRLTQSVVITPVIDFVLRDGRQPPLRLKVRAERATTDPDCEPVGVVELAD